MIRAVVTDIEGTTTPISFVKDVLFPRSRKGLRAFVAAHASDPEVKRILDEARALSGGGSGGGSGSGSGSGGGSGSGSGGGGGDRDDVISALERWIDEDRKVGPLKAIQGLLWEEGYRNGEIVTPLYPDVPGALRRFRDAGKRLFVYSSGSVHAQKLLFAHTEAGDLTPLFEGYFDTTTGPKTEAASYAAIARAIGLSPQEIVFLSDTKAELSAACSAGVLTVQLAREGASPFGDHLVTDSFDAIHVDGDALVVDT